MKQLKNQVHNTFKINVCIQTYFTSYIEHDERRMRIYNSAGGVGKAQTSP